MTLPPGSTMSMPSWMVVAVPLPFTCGFTSTAGRAAADDDQTSTTPSVRTKPARTLGLIAVPPRPPSQGNRDARATTREITDLALVVVLVDPVVEIRSAAPAAELESADHDR